jgi:hypothetical protein
MVNRTLSRYYENLQTRFPVIINNEYADLVIPNGNSTQAVHRWFHLKEGFSSGLLQHVLEKTNLINQPHLSILDSFVGVGTTIISALNVNNNHGLLPITAFGIECNPFLEFVAKTKVNAVQSKVTDFRNYIDEVVLLAQSTKTSSGRPPVLSTFHNENYFNKKTLKQLLRLRTAIETIKGSEINRDLARLCLAGTIEPVSTLRRDGRALRYVPNKIRPNTLDEFIRRALIVSTDIENTQVTNGRGSIYLADGRHPSQVLPENNKFDLIIFSPPYPNNIDYTEVYKLEAWFLRLINNMQTFREQRLMTLRSHPSVRFPDHYTFCQDGYKRKFETLLSILLDQIPEDQNWAWRCRLIKGYFDDLLITLNSHRPLMAKDGYLVYIVGNSLHGRGRDSFVIAADLLIASLAEIIGFEVESFVIARQLRRRAHEFPFMRESIVFLRNKK